jgi:hypothetical protein
MSYTLVYPTEIQVIAWIQNFPKLGEAEAGPDPVSGVGGDQLESSRDRGNMIDDSEKPIQNVMQKDQQPTE